MVDETNQGHQDTLAATPLPSDAGAGTTPQGEQSFTTEQVAKLLNDAKAEWGRSVKPLREELAELKLLGQEHETLQQDYERLQRERDEAEEATAREDPSALSVYKQKRALAERERVLVGKERELKRNQLQYQETMKTIERSQREQAAKDIASKHGVDAASLLDLTDGSPEKMEGLASILGKKPATPVRPPDSGATTGGIGKLTNEQIKKMSPDERFARREEIAKMPLG